MNKIKTNWKIPTIILTVILTLTILMMTFWPKRSTREVSRISYVERALSSLAICQESIKEYCEFDSDKNGVGEYAENIDLMSSSPITPNYITKDISINVYLMHYIYTIRLGNTIKEKENSFEIYALPKVVWSYDSDPDGVMGLAIDETGIIRCYLYDKGTLIADAPLKGTMKDWVELNTYYDSSDRKQSLIGKFLTSFGLGRFE